MRNLKMQYVMRGALAAVALSTVMAFAETSPTSGNPQTNASDRNMDTNQPNTVGGCVQKTEDAANRGLNHVDSGVHKMVRKTKHGAHRAKRGANNALNSVDNSIHEKTAPQ